jgi:hypothetical protein
LQSVKQRSWPHACTCSWAIEAEAFLSEHAAHPGAHVAFTALEALANGAASIDPGCPAFLAALASSTTQLHTTSRKWLSSALAALASLDNAAAAAPDVAAARSLLSSHDSGGSVAIFAEVARLRQWVARADGIVSEAAAAALSDASLDCLEALTALVASASAVGVANADMDVLQHRVHCLRWLQRVSELSAHGSGATRADFDSAAASGAALAESPLIDARGAVGGALLAQLRDLRRLKWNAVAARALGARGEGRVTASECETMLVEGRAAGGDASLVASVAGALEVARCVSCDAADALRVAANATAPSRVELDATLVSLQRIAARVGDCACIPDGTGGICSAGAAVAWCVEGRLLLSTPGVKDATLRDMVASCDASIQAAPVAAVRGIARALQSRVDAATGWDERAKRLLSATGAQRESVSDAAQLLADDVCQWVDIPRVGAVAAARAAAVAWGEQAEELGARVGAAVAASRDGGVAGAVAAHALCAAAVEGAKHAQEEAATLTLAPPLVRSCACGLLRTGACLRANCRTRARAPHARVLCII